MAPLPLASQRRSRSLIPVILLLLALLPDSLLSQRTDLKFQHISIEQGLSQSSVFSIFQDSKGLLWIGTLNGLNKYDGYRFTIYRSIPRDTTTLSNNTVFKILEDRNGILWIGTLGGGLNSFDRKSETFTRFRHRPLDTVSLSNDNVRAIFEDSGGRLWVGTNHGLNLYNPATRTFTRFHADANDQNSLSNNTIWSLHESASEPNVLWIGTYNGLNRYDVTTGHFTRYIHDPRDRNSLSNNYVWSIAEGEEGGIWVGTSGGLNYCDKRSGRFTRYRHSGSAKESIGNNNVWALARSPSGSLLVGTLGGGFTILLSDPGLAGREPRRRFLRFEHEPANPHSLSQNFVWSLLIDRAGIVWIGTDGGLNKLDAKKEKFVHYNTVPYDPNSLSNAEVTALYPDRRGALWVGTRNGLNRFNEPEGAFMRYFARPADPGGLSSDYVRSIREDRGGNLWVATGGGGVNLLPVNSKQFRHLRSGNATTDLSSNDVTSVFEDSEGTIWLGTLSGLNRYDPKTRTVAKYLHRPQDPLSLSHDYVYTVGESADHSLWIGTFGGGLNRLDRQTGTFTRFMENPSDTNSLIDNNIWCLYEDSDHALWIGTNNGLDRFDRTRNVFSHYDGRRGLPSNVIYGILPDRRGNLWISSNNGLFSFNPSSGSVRTYTTSDGLQSNQFGGNAYCSDPQGRMYFGGINGFNVFSPDSIRDNPYVPPIVLTDFLVFNASVRPGLDSPIGESIIESPVIHLSHAQNLFSFEFAALHYSAPEANRYAYRMEGFDKDWIQSGNRRFATFTNLDPGRYVFRVIGSNSDGLWNKEGAAVTVIISPPFWQTWWFVSLAALSIFSLVGGILYFRIRNLLAFERLRLEIAADLHDDIGTRLTEISLLTDMVLHQKSEAPGSSRETVRNIGNIARSLIESVSDIVWLINPGRDSLYDLFIKIKDSYEEILSYKQIQFFINNLNSLEHIVLPVEYRKHVYLIFKEAMNNALKYSECSEISINADVRGNLLQITLYDDGKGFDVQSHHSGNGLHDMQKRAESCAGTLRIQSNIGEGTMVRFSGTIPKAKSYGQ